MVGSSSLLLKFKESEIAFTFSKFKVLVSSEAAKLDKNSPHFPAKSISSKLDVAVNPCSFLA